MHFRQVRARVLSAIICMLLLPVASALAEYEVIEVINGGTIKGMATWKGEIPKIPPIKVFKHMDTCGQTVKSPALQVDSGTMGLRFVLVYLENVEKGKAPERSYPLHMGQTKTRPDSELCNFEEHVFPFVRTKSVALQNFEKLLHNPHGFAEGNSTIFNVAMPDPMKIVEKTFLRAQGVGLHFQCDTHVHMNGYMAGFDHPYFAVTDQKGKFEITGVPPGQYKLVMWHEGYNAKEFSQDHRPIYDEPHIVTKDVEVKGGDAVEVNATFPVRPVKVEWKIAAE